MPSTSTAMLLVPRPLSPTDVEEEKEEEADETEEEVVGEKGRMVSASKDVARTL